jgi:hypothetical protein
LARALLPGASRIRSGLQAWGTARCRLATRARLGDWHCHGLAGDAQSERGGVTRSFSLGRRRPMEGNASGRLDHTALGSSSALMTAWVDIMVEEHWLHSARCPSLIASMRPGLPQETKWQRASRCKKTQVLQYQTACPVHCRMMCALARGSNHQMYSRVKSQFYLDSVSPRGLEPLMSSDHSLMECLYEQGFNLRGSNWDAHLNTRAAKRTIRNP